ncbi:hypothetical protein FXB40_26790 [Bradyrhizobium rifense]|uniref:Uncharacterized protein n=1 Tax=Bradyrhizobium rifense TaxID=515499 RepID=A0A5D3K7X8_9BRAD|nr:hypothetical protein [Bradyrhizobium rifense]TYL92052.1 hypothetical protein FXB40_26790 [Bradyrhizobium rifense]
MEGEVDRELAILDREITKHRQHIKDQAILIGVLERDGHNISDQELTLKQERSELAKKITRQIALLQRTVIPAK